MHVLVCYVSCSSFLLAHGVFATMILLSLFFFHLAAAQDLKQPPPNIIFIFADDVGYGDLSCYGHPYAVTPNLDRLAREGTMFMNFHTTGAVCNPSRTGFMTSRHPASFPGKTDDFGFQGVWTITDLLKSAGYATGNFGKWHIGPEESDGTYGIDDVKVIGGKKRHPDGRDAELFNAAINFIELKKNQPFYVNIWAHIAHFPVSPPKSMRDKFAYVRVNRSDFGKHMQHKFDLVENSGGDIDEGMRNYVAEIWALDAQVGRVLKMLDHLALWHRTIVVFSSDQGPAPVKTSKSRKLAQNMMGYAGGLRGGKHSHFEGGVRVPFIVRWPGMVPHGTINDSSLISALDWIPTLCAAANVTIKPEMFEGENVSDIWYGANRSRTNPLFWRNSNPKASSAMLYGKWKLHSGKKRDGGVQLYDLDANPEEDRNVLLQNEDIANAMLDQLKLWISTLPANYDGGERNRFDPDEPPQIVGPPDFP